MKKLFKIILICLSVIGLASLVGLVYLSSAHTVRLTSGEDLSGYNTIRCEMVSSYSVDIKNNLIKYSKTPMADESTMVITDLQEDQPTLIGNIAEVPLYKVSESTDDTVYLVERNFSGNLNMWTIFKEEGILVVSKQYKIIFDPFVMNWYGACTGVS